jgi:hypothetical protein
MRISRVGVVLNGAVNDKDILQSAVRVAAREGAKVRVALAPGCTREEFEKHLDFALWDVQHRLGLPAPEVTLEAGPAEVDLEVHDATGQPVTSRRGS